MRHSKRLFLGITLALIALAAGVYVGIGTREARSLATSVPPEVIAQLFATRLDDAEGKPVSFAQWHGKTLIVNFWATWCPPCREEMPAFSRLQTKYGANGVQFVGIALDTSDNVKAFSSKHPVSYPLPIANSDTSELTRRLGNSQLALPYSVILGPGGEVLMTRLGRVSESELDALLQKEKPRQAR